MESHAKRYAVLAVLLLAMVMVVAGAATMPDAVPASAELLGAPSIPVGPLP